MIRIIGIAGKLNSGKGTAAKVLRELGYISFAMTDPLKVSLQEIFEELPDEVLWGPSKHRTGEIRRMLQELGTDFARKYRPDVWANKLRGRAYAWHFNKTDTLGRYSDEECREALGIAVPDVRFPNEADAILELGGTLIRITRKGSADHETEEARNHASETSVDLIEDSAITHTIHNDGNLPNFENNIAHVVSQLWKV